MENNKTRRSVPYVAYNPMYIIKQIDRALLLVGLIEETCDITIREIQGTYYLFIGNSIKGARPLTKEEMEILGEKNDN